MDEEKILKKIEKIRKDLNKLAEKRENIDQKVVAKSEELDKLLNQLQKLKGN